MFESFKRADHCLIVVSLTVIFGPPFSAGTCTIDIAASSGLFDNRQNQPVSLSESRPRTWRAQRFTADNYGQFCL